MLLYHIPNAQSELHSNFQDVVTYFLLTFMSYVVIII